MKNREAKIALIKVYGSRCLLTGTLALSRDLTYHHITKKEHGGPATVENGAQVLPSPHEWLHNELENLHPELFELVNECLQLYKLAMDQHNQPLIDEYENEVMPAVKERVLKYERRRR